MLDTYSYESVSKLSYSVNPKTVNTFVDLEITVEKEDSFCER